MRCIFFLIIMFSFSKCNVAPENEKDLISSVKEVKSVKIEEPKQEYSEVLNIYHQNLRATEIEEKKKIWFELISETMPKYWIGTDWDFNGVSRKPGKGSIACGYLVTTILEDSGLNLNRIALAQSPSSKMIKKLCKSSTIKRYSSLVAMKDEILKTGLENDVYILGLDFHTGFIIKEGEELYFFNSDYINDSVVKEPLEQAENLRASKTFMIGSLMQNENLFKNLN